MTRSPGEVGVDGLHVSYRRWSRSEHVLKGLNLTAGPASITAVVGHNGVGKTTLFRTLLGFQAPDRGRVAIDGSVPAVYRGRYGIGFVPEDVAFPASWTVTDVIGAGVDMAKGIADPKEAFEGALRQAGFDEKTASRPVNRCSKGIRQRLKLAFALIGDPQVLLLDEPFSGLDPASRVALRREIEAVRGRGATVLLASHDLVEVERLADRVYIMEDGTVELTPEGTGEDAGFGLEDRLTGGDR